MIVNSFLLAIGQIGDPRFRKVLMLGVGLTFALLVAAYAGFLWLIQFFVGEETTLPVLGPVTWLNDLLSVSSFIFMMVLSVFLMVPVASAITSMFLDEVAQAVEDKHYPQLPPVEGIPILDALWDSLGFLGVLIAANLAAFVLYVMFPPMSLFIFWAMNGFLLGREYFTLAAMRRVGRENAQVLRRRHSGTIWMAGTLMAVPLSVPLVNLLIPILGAATFTHIYHKLDKRG
ncbi:EI24 domain-containing protein [Primorskyibacter sp. S87]|uniref:EI24 domain-containing protein n=1 Tax=Primorskyibacter sp. S87 TaxID=3415126 RepID=UPI003C7C3261